MTKITKINDKKIKIEELTLMLLENSYELMKVKIKKALNSGSLDIDSWDEHNESMIFPKIIACALLEDEADQYKVKGTYFEKQVKKEVKNLKLFL